MLMFSIKLDKLRILKSLTLTAFIPNQNPGPLLSQSRHCFDSVLHVAAGKAMKPALCFHILFFFFSHAPSKGTIHGKTDVKPLTAVFSCVLQRGTHPFSH